MSDGTSAVDGDDEDFTWDETWVDMSKVRQAPIGKAASVPPGGRPLSDWGVRVDLRTVDQRVHDDIVELGRRLERLELHTHKRLSSVEVALGMAQHKAQIDALRAELDMVYGERNAVRAERDALAVWQEAFGLLTTLAPDLEIDVSDPLGMAKAIERHVLAERAALAAATQRATRRDA